MVRFVFLLGSICELIETVIQLKMVLFEGSLNDWNVAKVYIHEIQIHQNLPIYKEVNQL